MQPLTCFRVAASGPSFQERTGFLVSADEGPAPLTVFSDLAAAAKSENMVEAGAWQERPAGAVSA